MHTRVAQSALLKTLVNALLFGLMTAAPYPTSASTQDSGNEKKVLLLFSIESHSPGQTILERALRSTLQNGSSVPVEIYSEYLENAGTTVDHYEKELVGLLRRKYEGQRFDVIFAVVDRSLRLLLRNQAQLFPGTPIVFLVLEQRDIAGLSLGPNVTGVWGEINFKRNLELALASHPGIKEVVVVAGVGAGDEFWTGRAREDFRAYEDRLEFRYLIGLSIPELKQALATLSPNAIVAWMTSTRDTGGEDYISGDVLRQVSPASIVPIYGTTDAQLGLGILGGNIFSFEALGVGGAKAGLRILAGEKPDRIAPRGISNVTMFDWRQVNRWGINARSLPPGVIRFKEPSFWDMYKYYVVGAVGLLGLMTALAGALLLQRSRRARAEESRRLSEDKLSKAFRSSPDAFLITRQSDGAILEVNERWEELLGYSRAEALGSTTAALQIYERAKDQERILIQISKDGYVRDFQTNIRTKTGETRAAVLSSETVDINNETCLFHIIRDVTELKNSEIALRKMTGQLIRLRDEEQRRIAAELHDGLGQRLSIIKNRAAICMLDLSDQEDVHEQLEEISATAVSAITEVRAIAHNLRPSELDRLGLVAAVESMVSTVSNSSLIELSADLDQIDGRLSSEAETNVYRIVQEGLNNVIKHSEASEARVEIKANDGELIVSIHDNGKGFKKRRAGAAGANGGGFGLAGIAERAHLLGAVCEIDSEPGRGSTLRVRLQGDFGNNGH